MQNLFCEHCNRIMKIIEENEKKILLCSCGFTKPAEISFSEKSKKKEEVGEQISDGKKKKGEFPHICPKCKHEGCEVVDLGAQYSDESNVFLYVCDECGYVDRQADGSSNG